MPAKPQQVPYIGIACMLMGGFMLLAGGVKAGGILIAFAIFWLALAVFLKLRAKSGE